MSETDIEEQIHCLQNILECLAAALRGISKFTDFYSSEDSAESSDINEHFEEIIEHIEQTLECFSLSIKLIGSYPHPERIQLLVFEHNPEYVATLLHFLSMQIPLGLSEVNEKALVDVVITSLKTLSKFISICSYEAAMVYDANEAEVKRLAKQCAETVVAERGLDSLFHALQTSPSDQIRLSVIELLFVFVVRNEMGKFAVVVQRGLPLLLQALAAETVPMIRLHICGIIREFCTVYPEELLRENIVELCCKLINIDPSSEVRALSIEILEVLFKTDKSSFKYVSDYSKFARILSQRLNNDTNPEVVEANCRLVETLCSFKNNMFISGFVKAGGWNSLIRCIEVLPVRPAALAIRGLRFILQNSLPEHNLGYKIISHFPSLSVLFKTVLEHHSKKNQTQTIAHKLLKVELAICLALILAQNPLSRQHVHYELRTFPLWMATLRSAILGHLSYAETEYFADISIMDVTGANLAQSFNEDYPNGPAVKEMFIEQEKRFADYLLRQEHEDDFDRASFSAKSNADDNMSFISSESTAELTWGKLKSFILHYAIHLTFEPPKTSIAMYQQYADIQHRPISYEDLLQQPSPAVVSQSPSAPASHVQSQPVQQVQSPGNMPQMLNFFQQRMQNAKGSPSVKSTRSIDDDTASRQISNINQLSQSMGAEIPALLKPATPNNNGEGLNRSEVRITTPRNSQKPQKPRKPGDSHTLGTQLVDEPEPHPEDISQELLGPSAAHQMSQLQPSLVPAMLSDEPDFKEISIDEDVAEPPKQYFDEGAATPRTPGGETSSRNLKSVLVGLGPKKKSPKKTFDSKLERDLAMPRRFSQYFERHKLFGSPSHRFPLLRNYNYTGDGLVLRATKKSSPQKLTKSWSYSDVRDGDVFEFEISFDDVRVATIESLIQRCKKHQLFVKKNLVTCPQGKNAKGRRTFLLDMVTHIMPQIYATIEKFLNTVKEKGEEQMKMVAYLYKGNNKQDRSINHVNFLEVMQFITTYLAKNPQQMQSFERENEFASNMESALNSKFSGNTAISISSSSPMPTISPE